MVDKNLLSAQELMARLDIKESAFQTLIQAGMPGKFHNRRWYFHRQNVDEWLRRWTLIQEKIRDEMLSSK